ncbi:MAG: hypothetical protein JWN24_1763 [Phycisphaerales bacterium]|nr:hypothetical protein [Phycisphaerales bacterium]
MKAQIARTHPTDATAPTTENKRSFGRGGFGSLRITTIEKMKAPPIEPHKAKSPNASLADSGRWLLTTINARMYPTGPLISPHIIAGNASVFGDESGRA